MSTNKHHNLYVIDPPGASNFGKQTTEPEPYSSAPDCDSASCSSDKPVTESDSDEDDKKQVTEQDVFGTDSEDGSAMPNDSDMPDASDMPPIAPNTPAYMVLFGTDIEDSDGSGMPKKDADNQESDEDADPHDECESVSDGDDPKDQPATDDADATGWARWIDGMQQYVISELNDVPPDDLYRGYAETAMKLPDAWTSVLRDGIFDHDRLLPVLGGVLQQLDRQRAQGNELAQAALDTTEKYGYVLKLAPNAALLDDNAVADDDPPDPPDINDSAHAAFMATVPQVKPSHNQTHECRITSV